MYDKLISIKTSIPEINGVIATFNTYREEMFKPLDHPRPPLQNNDSERDIQSVVKKRNISCSTKIGLGREFQDILLTFK